MTTEHKPTLDEAKADLEDCARDRKFLKQAISGIEGFMNQPGAHRPEKRQFLRIDLWKYERYLAQNDELETKIHKHIEGLRAQQPPVETPP